MNSLRRLVIGVLAAFAAPADAHAGDAPGDVTPVCATPRQDDPQSLVDAAMCLAGAGLWGPAARHYQRVVVEFPQHALAEASLLRLVKGHLALARFADAAGLAELYAARYAKNPATLDLLQEAAQMRFGLGQRKQAFADLEQIDLLLQRGDPARAAEVYWSRRLFLLDREKEERVAHAKAFLERYGKAAELDRRVVAELTIAESLWRGACDKGLMDDLCVGRQWPWARSRSKDAESRLRPARPRPKWSRPERCGWDAMRVFPRNKARAAEAQRQLAAVLRLAASGDARIPEDQPQRRREYEDAVGLATLYVADQGFEEMLEIEVPDGLSFHVDEWMHDSGVLKWERKYKEQLERREASLVRFKTYYKSSQKLAVAAEQQYGQLAADKRSPRVTIAAIARLGQLGQVRADGLLGIEVPVDLVSEEQVDAFCGELNRQTDEWSRRASATYTRCLELSALSGEFTNFSRLCEAALQRVDPRGYPVLSELTSGTSRSESFGGPARPITRMEVIGVQEDPAPFMSMDMDGP